MISFQYISSLMSTSLNAQTCSSCSCCCSFKKKRKWQPWERQRVQQTIRERKWNGDADAHVQPLKNSNNPTQATHQSSNNN